MKASSNSASLCKYPWKPNDSLQKGLAPTHHTRDMCSTTCGTETRQHQARLADQCLGLGKLVISGCQLRVGGDGGYKGNTMCWEASLDRSEHDVCDL